MCDKELPDQLLLVKLLDLKCIDTALASTTYCLYGAVVHVLRRVAAIGDAAGLIMLKHAQVSVAVSFLCSSLV